MNPVKAISNVNLDHVCRAMSWVSVHQLLQEALQSVAELHGMLWCQWDCVGVHTMKTEIHNRSWQAVMWGDHADLADLKVGQIAD